MKNDTNRYPTIFLLTAYLLFAMLFIYSVIVAKNFLYPIVLGILFAYLLFPIANFFEKIGLARILANLLSIVIGMGVLVAVFYLMSKQLRGLLGDFPAIRASAMRNADSITQSIGDLLGVSQDSLKVALRENIGKMLDTGSQHLTEILRSTTGGIVRIGLLPVFIFFLLYYRDKAYYFILMVTKIGKRDIVKHVIDEVSNVTKQYMGGVFIVVTILSIINPIGLYIVGVDYPIMLGVIAAICNFIPYFGTIIGFAFPLVFALITSSPHVALGVIILFAIVQFTENNILTPNIVGGNVKLNPFIIILSLIVGAMIWGVAGMFVIVPLIAVIRIICENIRPLRPYAYLLGTKGTERHSITLVKMKRLLKKITLKKRKTIEQ